jgi:hypothetical protein
MWDHVAAQDLLNLETMAAAAICSLMHIFRGWQFFCLSCVTGGQHSLLPIAGGPLLREAVSDSRRPEGEQW